MNALSLAKLGIGFGVLAVASIGLLSPAPVEASSPPDHVSGAPDDVGKHLVRPANWQPRHEFDTPVISPVMVEAPVISPVMAVTQSKVSDSPVAAPIAQTIVAENAILATNDAEALALILALIDDL